MYGGGTGGDGHGAFNESLYGMVRQRQSRGRGSFADNNQEVPCPNHDFYLFCSAKTFLFLLLPPPEQSLNLLKDIAGRHRDIVVSRYNSSKSRHDPQIILSIDSITIPNTTQVRQSVVELVGVVYGKVGLNPIEPFLADLRPAQRDVFDAEFERVGGENYHYEKSEVQESLERTGVLEYPINGAHQLPPDVGPDSIPGEQVQLLPGAGAGNMPVLPPTHYDLVGAGGDQHDPRVGSSQYVGAGGTPGAAAAGAGIQEVVSSGAETRVEDEEEHVAEPFQCQFCLLKDPSFTPEALDIHYWWGAGTRKSADRRSL